MLTDRQMDKKQTDKQMELHQFRKESSYDVDLSPYQVWIRQTGQSVFKLESGNENVDGQTDMDGRRTHQSNRRVGYMQPA